jgi:hypothetical protein
MDKEKVLKYLLLLVAVGSLGVSATAYEKFVEIVEADKTKAANDDSILSTAIIEAAFSGYSKVLTEERLLEIKGEIVASLIVDLETEGVEW